MTYTLSPLTLSSVNVTNQQEIADLVTFTDEIFKETSFFCAVICVILQRLCLAAYLILKHLMTGGNKRSYVQLKLQVCLSTHELLLPPGSSVDLRFRDGKLGDA